MKIRRSIFAVVLIIALITLLSACGSSSDSSSSAASEAMKGTGPVAAASSQLSAEAMSTPAPDKAENAESLIGKWVQSGDASKFANITKTDSGYQYEDNDGKYTATFKDGALDVAVDTSSTAKVYVDAKTGNLILEYDKTITRFIR
jgi:hypothetical protein